MFRITAMIAAGLLATSVSAQDRTGYRAIATGDLAAAERQLTAERRIFPARPELMLNLAAIYARTARTGDARALYTDVLARPAVAMDLPDGSVRSSHDIASAGLIRLSPMASR